MRGSAIQRHASGNGANLVQAGDRYSKPEEIGEMLQPWLENDPERLAAVVAGNLFERARNARLFPYSSGCTEKWEQFVAGSQRADFPQQTERLVLNIAANQAAIGLQESSLLSTKAGRQRARSAGRATNRGLPPPTKS